MLLTGDEEAGGIQVVGLNKGIDDHRLTLDDQHTLVLQHCVLKTQTSLMSEDRQVHGLRALPDRDADCVPVR